MPSNLETRVSLPIFVIIFCAMNDSTKRLASVGLTQARPNQAINFPTWGENLDSTLKRFYPSVTLPIGYT